MSTRKEKPMPTPLAPDLPDPDAIDAAAQDAFYAEDLREAQTHLRKLAKGNAERVAGYRLVGADPRIRQWTDLLRKVEGKFPPEHRNLLENVSRRLIGPRRWQIEADQAEEAERRIGDLSGPECQRISPEAWQHSGIWNGPIDRLASRLLIVSRTEAQLRQELDALEPDVIRVLQLYAGGVAQRDGPPPVVATESPRGEPLTTVLDFNPMRDP